ncbi:acetylglutamate kinase, partial [Micromonospora haikouensis]
DPHRLVSENPADERAELRPALQSGWVPMMVAGRRGGRGGGPAAHVVDGRVAHSTLLEVFTSEGFGTMVVSARSELASPAVANREGAVSARSELASPAVANEKGTVPS